MKPAPPVTSTRMELHPSSSSPTHASHRAPAAECFTPGGKPHGPLRRNTTRRCHNADFGKVVIRLGRAGDGEKRVDERARDDADGPDPMLPTAAEPRPGRARKLG